MKKYVFEWLLDAHVMISKLLIMRQRMFMSNLNQVLSGIVIKCKVSKSFYIFPGSRIKNTYFTSAKSGQWYILRPLHEFNKKEKIPWKYYLMSWICEKKGENLHHSIPPRIIRSRREIQIEKSWHVSQHFRTFLQEISSDMVKICAKLFVRKKSDWILAKCPTVRQND